MRKFLKKDLRQTIDTFFEHKLITPCHSPYTSPAVFFRRNGKPREVIDYRRLNKETVTFGFGWPLRSIEEVLDTFGKICYFSPIDMSWGLYQLSLELNSQNYTAIKTSFGFFKCLFLQIGLRDTPPIFESLMEKFLLGLTRKNAISYLNDCVISSFTTEENIDRLLEVFQSLKHAKLRINLPNCEFLSQREPFLGYIVTRDGIASDPAKTSAVRQYPLPKSITEVSFLGHFSCHRR